MLSIGIVGLPNVGKSTLFRALTGRAVPCENYPFCTIDPAVGVVAVPDKRLDKLAAFSGSKKIIPAAVEFTDIAGLVKGASTGEGLGNQFLANIRQTDAIAEVVRVFEDGNITHVHGAINPLHDINVINLELVLADYQTVSKRRGNIAREVKQNKKEALAEDALLARLEKHFDEGHLASTLSYTDEERAMMKSLHLLSAKPILYIVNKKTGQKIPADLAAFFKDSGSIFVELDIASERDISEFPEEERVAMRKDFGVSEAGLDELIKKSYELLGLMSYLTTGPEETRGWTVKIGSTAPEAGAAIHTDFREKFIRAEIIACDDLIAVGSYAAARDKGLLRTEGKDYIVKDGDVIEFRV